MPSVYTKQVSGELKFDFLGKFYGCNQFTGEAKMGTDESAFNAILATRSWPQIRQIMAEYQALRGNTLEKAVLSEFSANAEKGLLGICKL